MTDQQAVYRSPAREYLIGLLSAMRSASGQAQRALIQYAQEQARIAAQVKARAEEEEWTEDAEQTVLKSELAASRVLPALQQEYDYQRRKANWHAQQLQTEASVYWLLYQEETPPETPQPDVQDHVLRVDQPTMTMPAMVDPMPEP